MLLSDPDRVLCDPVMGDGPVKIFTNDRSLRRKKSISRERNLRDC
jgi:hypothetical protein